MSIGAIEIVQRHLANSAATPEVMGAMGNILQESENIRREKAMLEAMMSQQLPDNPDSINAPVGQMVKEVFGGEAPHSNGNGSHPAPVAVADEMTKYVVSQIEDYLAISKIVWPDKSPVKFGPKGYQLVSQLIEQIQQSSAAPTTWQAP